MQPNNAQSHPSRDRPAVFLEELRIEFGPANLLGRFFLAAEKVVRDTGITLSLSSLAAAAALQSQNLASWTIFPPMLDTRLCAIASDMSYALLGRNLAGEIVCAQGGRIYDIGERTLASIMADHSFFYGDGSEPLPGQPICDITAPAADRITGRFVYSGALWVRPDHRGHRLAAVLPRISRSYALSRWNTAHTIAVVSEQIARSPLLAMYGYKTVEPTFRMHNVGDSLYVGYLMSMTVDELLDDLSAWLAGNLAQIDAAVGDGGSQDLAPAGGRAHR